MKHKLVLLIFLMLTIYFVAYNNVYNNADEKQANIIRIMADYLGYGELSCYGSTKIHSPNIDSLDAQGIRFTDYLANGPVCTPSRAALRTGKVLRTGVEGVITTAGHRKVGLSLDETTLAEV